MQKVTDNMANCIVSDGQVEAQRLERLLVSEKVTLEDERNNLNCEVESLRHEVIQTKVNRQIGRSLRIYASFPRTCSTLSMMPRLVLMIHCQEKVSVERIAV